MGKNETEETKKNYINCFNERIQLIEEDFKSIKSIFDKIDGQVEKKKWIVMDLILTWLLIKISLITAHLNINQFLVEVVSMYLK